MREVLRLLIEGLMKSIFLIQAFCWKQRAVKGYEAKNLCHHSGQPIQSNYHIMCEQTARNTCHLHMALIVLQ